MATVESLPTKPDATAGSRKYLTFVLGHESYGVGVLQVREIIRMLEITTVPQMPAYVKGVINLRGKVVPIVDLRVKFALAKAENTERTCVVVVEIKSKSGVKMNPESPAFVGQPSPIPCHLCPRSSTKRATTNLSSS
jgi:chemotaxis signal transduction protein